MPSTGEVRAMVEAVAQAARLVQARSSPVAWHPPLPDVIVAEDVVAMAEAADDAADEAAADEAAGERLAAVIAVADRPELQSQAPLVMNLGTGAHWAFIGSGGSGRTTALLTAAYALAARVDPRRLHLHAISEGSLRELERLPHCGVHAASLDRPRLDRFLTRMEAELATRRRALSQHGFRSMSQWWATTTPIPNPPAALLLLVDDWHLLAQPSHEPAGHWAAERLVALMRAGQGLGLVAAVAGDRSIVVGSTGTVLTNRVVLRLADPTDAVLAGLKPAWVPGHQPPGRGILADGTQIQLILPTSGPTTGRTPPGAAATADGRSPALRVDPLPDVVPEAQLPLTRDHDGYLLGVGDDQARPLSLTPAADGRRWVVCGGPGSGVSTTLLLLARQLLERGRHVVVVSGRAGPLERLRADRRLALWVQAGDPAPLVALHGRLPHLAVVVDAADELVDAPVQPVLQEVCRLADQDDALVLCGARSGALTTQFTGLAADVARFRTGVLLGPASPTEARALGVQVMEDPQAPPGRGYLLRQGTGTRLQVALPDV